MSLYPQKWTPSKKVKLLKMIWFCYNTHLDPSLSLLDRDSIRTTPHQDNSSPCRYWSWWVILPVDIGLVGSCPRDCGTDGQLLGFVFMQWGFFFLVGSCPRWGVVLEPFRISFQLITHPRTGFIIRRIKSLFHHSNWQHIFLISFNGTSKRGVMRYNKNNKKIIWFFFGQTLPICMKIVEFQSLKALPIWRFFDNFSLEKSCDRLVHWTVINIGSNWRGNFSLSVELSSFIFLLLYHELWVMIRNVHVLWTLCVDGLSLVSMMSCKSLAWFFIFFYTIYTTGQPGRGGIQRQPHPIGRQNWL